MNTAEMKKVVREACKLSKATGFSPMRSDTGYYFVSDDDEYWARFQDDENYKVVQTKVLSLDAPSVSLEELEKRGVQWNFTVGVMDILCELTAHAKERIQQHEYDVDKFSSMVDELSGETILGCL